MGADFTNVWRMQAKKLHRANKKLIRAYEEMAAVAEVSRDKVAGSSGIDDALKKEIVAAMDEIAEGALEGLEGARAMAASLKESMI